MAMLDETVDVEPEVYEKLKKDKNLKITVERYVALRPLELTYGPESEFQNGS